MNNTQTNKQVVEKTSYDFTNDLNEFTSNDFLDKNFKDDYVLAIRLSYGEEKQKESIYNDYIAFLKNDLKVINDKNELNTKSKKANSYFFVFKKTNNFDNYFKQLFDYANANKEKLDVAILEKIHNILQAKIDLFNDNFTISNFELTKNKVKNFISFCLNKKLIER